MKRDTINYLVVGIFVLVMLVALTLLLLVITDRRGATDEYFVTYSSVAGVSTGTPIYFEGYTIGEVDEVDPIHGQPGGVKFKVTLDIKRGWPIPKDSVATVVSAGLLADVSISIVEGSSQEMLPPGSELQGKEGTDVFTAFNELAIEVKALTERSIRPLVDSLGSTLGEGAKPIIEDLRALLIKLNKSADGLNVVLGPDNQQEFTKVLKNLNQTTTDAGTLMRELQQTRAHLDALMLETNKLMVDTGGAVSDARPELRQAARDLRVSMQTIAERIDAIVQQLDGTTRNLNEFSREIRANPSSLLSGTPPKDDVKGKEKKK